jgi:large subunit ribosomal protein L18
MATKKPKTVAYRRKREGKTNYKKRLSLLLSQKNRVVVRFTQTQIIGQVVSFEPKGDKVIVSNNSLNLKKLGWDYSCKNIPASYLAGLDLGKKAVSKGIKEAILDTGFKSPLRKGRVYAFLKGVMDAGVQIPNKSDDIFPSQDRIEGKHIESYADSLKSNDVALNKQFSKYLKNKVQPQGISAKFNEIKQKIESA